MAKASCRAVGESSPPQQVAKSFEAKLDSPMAALRRHWITAGRPAGVRQAMGVVGAGRSACGDAAVVQSGWVGWRDGGRGVDAAAVDHKRCWQRDTTTGRRHVLAASGASRRAQRWSTHTSTLQSSPLASPRLISTEPAEGSR